MHIVDVEDLTPTLQLERGLYDPLTGSRLVRQGEPLTERILESMRRHGQKRVALLDRGESIESLLRKTRFKAIDLKQIRSGQSLGTDLFDEKGYLLLSRGTPFNARTLDRLARRRIQTVYVRRPPDANHLRGLKLIRSDIANERERFYPRLRLNAEDMLPNARVLTVGTVTRTLEEMEALDQLVVQTDAAEALLQFVRMVDAMQARPDRTKQEYLALYEGLIRQTSHVFRLLRTRETVDGDLLHRMAERIVQALVEDRQLLLCTIFLPVEGEDYLARHAINVCILAVNIAALLDFAPRQVMEVGYSALLADVGMLRIPDSIRFKRSPLTPSELLEVKRHTIYGIDELQRIHQLPRAVPLVAYQSHERLDGSGYPHGKSSSGIHDYAKLVAIADVYHAMIAQRPHRSTPKLPYQAVEELLKMGARKKLERRFLRGLLSAVSLFPVGSWVELSTGERARVVGAHGDAYTRPIVTVLYDALGRTVPPRRVNLLESETEVIRAAEIEESEPLQGL